MRAMIEYPGKTEDEIREFNRALGRRVGGAILGALAYVGTHTNPHIANLDRMEVQDSTTGFDEDEGGEASAV